MTRTWHGDDTPHEKVSMPTESQRKRVCHLASMAFVDIREMLWKDGNSVGRATHLADAFHNILDEINGDGIWNISTFRGQLFEHQNRYGGRDYVAYLDKIFVEET